MKYGLFAAAVAAALFGLAGAANAQSVTGTVNFTGSVGLHCSVIPGAGPTFSDTFALGELSQADGRLRSISPISTAGHNIRVNCSSTPLITISATPLATLAQPAPGYAISVNYHAQVAVDLADGSQAVVGADSGAAPSSFHALNFMKNQAENVVVTASNFTTAAPTDIMLAGSYTGTITVTISPT